MSLRTTLSLPKSARRTSFWPLGDANGTRLVSSGKASRTAARSSIPDALDHPVERPFVEKPRAIGCGDGMSDGLYGKRHLGPVERKDAHCGVPGGFSHAIVEALGRKENEAVGGKPEVRPSL